MNETVFKYIFFLILTSITISAILGLIWSIFYLLFAKNIKAGFQLFLSSFFGGFLGAMFGLIIGYLVGLFSTNFVHPDIFVIDASPFYILFFTFVFWIVGIIAGAVLGGLTFLKSRRR
ncbi:hypothetical protein C7B62_16990 [Pleurocapsa sp. CCALA 161]|uniref:hypothetical protein n=1 Tax=Pleurocapsa sp. CCALA 161 TaxID=2107688 RepID=UPI000D085A08|nr:hypothetical protein [Pleurocapsa sp. CCALA 161]PSB08386.1 hypothetical protein C7B62_16990 [Pleurocapsa sp. CCALA 161]